MYNRDNARDVDIFPDEKITKRSEPTNQAQAKINIAKSLETVNDLRNYLTIYQGFKVGLLPSYLKFALFDSLEAL